MKATIPDGLYQVTKGQICAGFVVEGGSVVQCAPCLGRRLMYWITIAKWIGP